MICLDTTFIIDFLKNDKFAVEKAKKLKDEQLTTTQINVFEILFGIYRLKDINHKKHVESAQKLFDKLTIFKFDDKAVSLSAKIAGDLIQKGTEIDQNDCLITGMMLANSCKTILTRNKRHFERISGIKAIVY